MCPMGMRGGAREHFLYSLIYLQWTIFMHALSFKMNNLQKLKHTINCIFLTKKKKIKKKKENNVRKQAWVWLHLLWSVSIKYTGIASSYSCKKLYKYTHYRKQGRLPKEIELILIIICRLNVIWNEWCDDILVPPREALQTWF